MCREIFWKENKFPGGTCLFHHFGFFSRKNNWVLPTFFLHFWQNCVLRLQRIICYFCSNIFFNFFITFGIRKFFVTFFTQNFRRICQKYILRVRMTIWWKIGLPLKRVTFFSSFWVFKQKTCGIFGGKISVRLSELHFSCTEDHFGWRDIFLVQKGLFLSVWT